MPTPPATDADDRPPTTRSQASTGSEPGQARARIAAVLRSVSGTVRFVTSGNNGRWLPLRLWLHIALFFGIAVASVFVLWVIFEEVFSAGLKDELKVEVIRLILYIIAGIGGVFALVIAYRRQGLNEAAEVRVERAEAREESKVFNERFKSAAEQMSSDHAANRLAGVYAMAGLADDWDQGRQTCISVLCAYLRMPFDPPTGQPPPEGVDGVERAAYLAEERTRSQEAQVRETIISVIRSRLRDEPVEGRTWHGCDFDFTKAYFDDADFSGIRLSDGVMSFRKIVHTSGRLDFQGIVVTGGTLAFNEAEFSGGEVDFTGADLSGGDLDFPKARVSRGQIFFRGAKCSGSRVSFMLAELSGGDVSFSIAEISSGWLDFRGAKFTGSEVRFIETVFSGGLVSFSMAGFSGSEVDFTQARFTGSRVRFNWASFTSTGVDLSAAEFSGGKIDFTDSANHPENSGARPLVLPGFPRFEDGIPECLQLPPGWAEAVLRQTSGADSPPSD